MRRPRPSACGFGVWAHRVEDVHEDEYAEVPEEDDVREHEHHRRALRSRRASGPPAQRKVALALSNPPVALWHRGTVACHC